MTTKTQADSQRTDLPVEPSFGWNDYAERVNSRFAMMGFVILLLLELVSGQDLFTWLGLR